MSAFLICTDYEMPFVKNKHSEQKHCMLTLVIRLFTWHFSFNTKIHLQKTLPQAKTNCVWSDEFKGLIPVLLGKMVLAPWQPDCLGTLRVCGSQHVA